MKKDGCSSKLESPENENLSIGNHSMKNYHEAKNKPSKSTKKLSKCDLGNEAGNWLPF